MTKRPRTLTAAFVRTVSRPGVYGDGRGGRGLSLRVYRTVNGRIARTWRQRVRIDGRLTSIGLGQYPEVTLADARQKALDNSRRVRRGQDPRGRGVPTFGEAARRTIELHRDSWKAGSPLPHQWESTFRLHAAPLLDKPVDRITSADVLACLGPIWNSMPTAARKARHRISAVFRWSIGRNYRRDNPVDRAVAALPKPNGNAGGHHRALPPGEIAAALRSVRRVGDGSPAAMCVELMVLTGVRPGEARGARWDEIDMDAARWTIPAARMKAGREFTVPLSTGALSVLRKARKLSDKSPLVFPSRTGRALAPKTVSRVLQIAGVDSTLHGFRSSARSWMAETGVPVDAKDVGDPQIDESLHGCEASDGGVSSPQVVVAEPDAEDFRPHARVGIGPAVSPFRERGADPRLCRNAVVFLAPDRTRLQDLDEAIRLHMAWQSILDEKDTLNLKPFQVKQAETRLEDTDRTVKAQIPEVFQWLLVPVQSAPDEEVGWEAIRLMGAGELAVRASTRLRREELLVTSYGSTRLRMDLDRIPLWKDHVEIRELADHYSRYTYLQRVEDPSVIAESVRDGVGRLTWESDTFAYAEGYDEEKGRYLGFQAGAALPPLTADSPGLVVRPDVARKQLDAERPDPGPEPGSGPGLGPEPGPGPAPPPSAGPKRFHGSVAIDTMRAGKAVGQIAEEVVSPSHGPGRVHGRTDA